MKCVWCSKKGSKKFHARVAYKGLDSRWYRCGTCDSLMILPRPSQKEIAKVYEDNYRTKRLQPHEGVDNRIRYSKQYRPTVFNEYRLSLTDLGITKKGIKSVLDFGCADGIFLEFCTTYFSKGTTLYGTDISSEMLMEAKKKGFQAVTLEELRTLPFSFDLITLWDVLEHLPNPEEVIKELKKHLSQKGKIVIQTPRFGVLGELYGETWEHLLPVQHLSIASKEGMQKFAQRAGLSVEVHKSFGANAPASQVAQPYKRVFDTLAKQLDFGDVQIVLLERILSS